MPSNLWIFPLISGYIIISKYIYFKYKYQRLSSQRLLLHSVIAGIISYLIFYSIRIIIGWLFPSIIPFLYRQLYKLPIREEELLWTSISGFLLVLISVYLLNYIYKKKNYFSWKKPVEKAVDDVGDEIEQIFKQSATDKILIQVTLKNNKVYVGFTDKIPPPQETNFLKLVPVISGYRKSETKELVFTTEYFEASKIYSESKEKYTQYEMDIILKQDEILTAGVFDLEIYNTFNQD